MLSSSQQASLTGRFGNSEYGRSKKAGEDLFLQYGQETDAKVLVYRFPNLFGKWCRPNYNSAVATFCNAFVVVSDSGTLPEESSFFTSVGHPFPAVCIRTSTERPEALDKGCFFIAGIDTDSLLQAVECAVEMNRNADNGIPVPDYVDENVSTKVVKIIQSYTGIVNRMVWRKN